MLKQSKIKIKAWARTPVLLFIVLAWLRPVSQLVVDIFQGNGISASTLAVDTVISALITSVVVVIRQRFNNLLTEESARHIRLFKNNTHPMWIYELESLRFLAVNNAAVALYGYSEEEFLSMRIIDIRPEEDVPALILSTDKIRENFNHQYHWGGRWRHRKKDAQLIYVEVSSQEIIFEDKKSELVLAYNITEQILQDQKLHLLNQELERKVVQRTTDLLQLNRRLVDQNKVIKSANLELFTLSNQLQEANEQIQQHSDLKSRFVSMASHEFRTPLANITFTAGFLRHHLSRLDSENVADKLKGIENQVAHMAALLEDVLVIGKTEVTKLEPNRDFVDLESFLEKIAQEVQIANKNSHNVLLTISKNDVQRISTDERFLRNIFINLLNNAIKYSPDRDEVYLNVYCESGQICFEVADRGIGIPRDEQEKIFEPFYRTNNTNHIQGTGLGLSIVKRAVDLLGGKIHLQSETGIGSTFSVMIPIT